MCYNQTGDISTLDGTPLKLVDKFTYQGNSVESTKKDIDTRLTKAWTAISRLSILWKSDLTNKMKRSFFQAAVVSILLYGCTTWTLKNQLEKKIDGNYTRMLRTILNPSLPYYFPIAGGRIIGFIPFPRVLVLCEIAISLGQDCFFFILFFVVFFAFCLFWFLFDLFCFL